MARLANEKKLISSNLISNWQIERLKDFNMKLKLKLISIGSCFKEVISSSKIKLKTGFMQSKKVKIKLGAINN